MLAHQLPFWEMESRVIIPIDRKDERVEANVRYCFAQFKE